MKMLARVFGNAWVWFVALPVVVALGYWFGLHALAFSGGSVWRMPALPKVFFDQTMYLQVIAKDLLHGFSILPPHMWAFEWIARGAWPGVSLSELYVVGVILSAIASLWMAARLAKDLMQGEEIGETRVAVIASFLLAHALLVLRPGGPSWYVPFFLAALVCAWLGERAFASGKMVQGAGWWVVSFVLSAAYPWYFASVVALCGLLALVRFLRARAVLPGVVIGLLIASGVFFFRDAIVAKVLSLPSVILAYYVGIQFSHLTTLSNTIMLMLAWTVLWLPSAVRTARHDHHHASVPLFFLAAWVGQLILWFQSVFTGLSIIPDHFIYSVWMFSALSWLVWRMPKEASRRERVLQTVIGCFAAVYVLSVIVRIALGLFAWTTYPSLVIHIASWTFLALAALPFPRRRLLLAGAMLGIASAIMGGVAVVRGAADHAAMDKELDGVRAWMMQQRPSTDLKWCSDLWGSDFLFSTTGQTFYPNFSDKHETVSLTQLQNRLVELSQFFNPNRAGELYIWDDTILHDGDFPCRAFGPGIALMSRVPMSEEARNFITGCNQSWADGERARVIAQMDAQWEKDIQQDSALCDRFVTRRRLWDSWRVPVSYEMLYKDDMAAVFGKK
jgi:hypothetical protein